MLLQQAPKAMSEVTLCLTIGRRPQLLEQTLSSLLALFDFEEIIAINDFRDEPTNSVFRKLCPNGMLISLDRQLGHHRAIDHMYGQVKTSHIMHCEDDWLFDQHFDLGRAFKLLASNSKISQVCFRKVSDFNMNHSQHQEILQCTSDGVDYFRLDSLHPQWHGYTFNPHLSSIKLWKDLGGFSKFKKERHVSRALRAEGRFSAYIQTGCCTHIGENLSVSPSAANPSPFRRLRKSIKGFFS